MLPITAYTVGMTAQLSRQFSAEDVDCFAKLSGDINPVHLDEGFAKQTVFGARIVHGALAASLFSTLFANQLPGAGCIYLKSENKFLKPIYLNESVDCLIEVTEVIVEKNRVVFKTSAISKNQLCIVGTAELYIPA